VNEKRDGKFTLLIPLTDASLAAVVTFVSLSYERNDLSATPYRLPPATGLAFRHSTLSSRS